MSKSYLLPAKKTQLPEFIKEGSMLPSAMNALKTAFGNLRTGQFLNAALNAHFATIKAGVAYSTNPELATRIFRTARRLIAMAVLGQTEVVPEQSLIYAETGKSLNPVMNGFGMGASWFKELLTGKSLPEIIRERRAETIGKQVEMELHEGNDQAMDAGNMIDFIKGSMKVLEGETKARALAQTYPDNTNLKRLHADALQWKEIVLETGRNRFDFGTEHQFHYETKQREDFTPFPGDFEQWLRQITIL